MAMRRTELPLTKKDRRLIAAFRAKGMHSAREFNRAHVLAALDRGLSEAQIMDVLGVGRTAIWRTRAAYLQGGLEYALHDVARPGKPRQYDTDVEAPITALACSAPPTGANRWTLVLLEQAAQAQEGLRRTGRVDTRPPSKKNTPDPSASKAGCV